MAYSNQGYTIYGYLKALLEAGVAGLVVENRHYLPVDTDEKEYLVKIGKGCLIRLNTDEQNDVGIDYNDRNYLFILRCYIFDTEKDQKKLMDYLEEVKYILLDNRELASGVHIKNIGIITFVEPDGNNNFKYADLELEVLYDG